MATTSIESAPLEIERKYLIKKPRPEALLSVPGCVSSEITQTYLLNPEAVERVRKRVYADKTVYTHTLKKRISALSVHEAESEIGPEEYEQLLLKRDPARNIIRKTRYALPCGSLVAEVDVYPFWQRQAVMEIELPFEDAPVSIPPCITLLREVTGNHAYSNNQLSLRIPEEDA